jgi:very-short-patch-repair endonuclease
VRQEIEKIFEERSEKVTIEEEYDTGYYIVDLYIPELHLIIEVDGMSHYSGMQFLGDFND